MSARPVLRLPVARVFEQSARPRQQLRCLHSPPRRRQLFPQRQLAPGPIQGLQQRRHASSFLQNTRILFRRYPYSMSLAFACIALGVYTLIYVNYVYQTYIIGAFHKYPEPVAVKLRRALYYTNQDVQPKEAIKYYKQALQVAEEVGMDPFSDEVLGIKVQIAAFMEQLQQLSKAVQVLEVLRGDCLEWLTRFGDKEENKQKRTRILQRCVSIALKLGDLYSQPAIWDRDAAEERLVWAVETVLKENQRRQSISATDETDGPWLSAEENGAAMEALAHSYEAKGQHYLSTPLFLHALTLHPPKTCHVVVLMNNLASSLAQQSPRAAAAAQAYAESSNIGARSGPPTSRQILIQDAKVWARKALDVAADIKPPERNEECDVGCAVALHNLGEFAEMSGEVAEARRLYHEAVSLARAVEFEEGVELSSARLRRLDGKSEA